MCFLSNEYLLKISALLIGHKIFKRSMFVLAALKLAVAALIALKIKLRWLNFSKIASSKQKQEFQVGNGIKITLN